MPKPLARLFLLGLHVLSGAMQIALLFPWLSNGARERLIRVWSRAMLGILGVRVEIEGALPPPGVMLVANHVSWLDIISIHATLHCRFVSKAEVARWPLIGWMARQAGTLFLVRENKRDAVRINRHIADLLRQGERLAVFPEGTSSDGRSLLPFYSALFDPTVQAGATVAPLLIRYLDDDGHQTDRPAYHGDITLWQSLRAVLSHGPIGVRLDFLTPIYSQGLDRRTLTQSAETALRERLAICRIGPV